MSHDMIFAVMTVGYSVALILGIWLYIKTKKFLKTAHFATGTIVGREGHLTIDMRGGTNAPVVEFKTPDGKKHTFSGRVTVPWKKPIGKTVKVLYDPENPEDALLATWVEIHTGWVLFVSVGLMGLAGLWIASFVLS